jgi:hypothetical protein
MYRSTPLRSLVRRVNQVIVMLCRIGHDHRMHGGSLLAKHPCRHGSSDLAFNLQIKPSIACPLTPISADFEMLGQMVSPLIPH